MNINQFINDNMEIKEVIASSLHFDELLKEGNYNKLYKESEILKIHFNKLMSSSKELINLLNELSQINENAIDILNKNNLIAHKINKNNNTLLLFYGNDSNESKEFFKEWKEMMNTDENINYVSIDCNKIKYKNICDKFKIRVYPAIKFIKNGQIVDYNGKLTKDSITKELLL